MRVAVVILCWNGKKFLERFLPSVTKSTYPDLEIIVADNASTDDSVDYLKTHWKDIRLIEIDKNEGFATGYNTALAQVNADIYVLLNQDVEVEAGWIEPVVEMMSEDEVAIVQPKILWAKDKRFFEYAGGAGGFMDSLGFPFCRGRIFYELEMDTGQYDDPVLIFWASGAAMFIKSKVFHAMGGLDDDFFAHMEEIDLCWRTRNAGYRILYCPDSVVYHVGGGSLPQEDPRKTFLNYRNNMIMLIKNLPARQLWWKFPVRILLNIVSAYRELIKSNGRIYLAIAKAHLHIYSNLPGWFRKRKQVKQSVRDNRIGPPDKSGYFKGLIIWQYFIKGKKKFSDLM